MSSHLITDLETVQKLAVQQRDAFEVLRHQLQLDEDLTDEQIDRFVESIAAPVVQAVDCTRCGNCCRALDVYLQPEDVERVADGTGTTYETAMARFVDQERAAAEGEWGVFRSRPCAFLCGSLCSIYPHRPDACRRYPQFTPEFRWVLEDLIEGAAICPIIYNVLVRVAQQVDQLQARAAGQS